MIRLNYHNNTANERPQRAINENRNREETTQKETSRRQAESTEDIRCEIVDDDFTPSNDIMALQNQVLLKVKNEILTPENNRNTRTAKKQDNNTSCGSTRRTSSNKAINQETLTNPDGSTSTLTYANGVLQSSVTKYPDGTAEKYEYNEQGDLIKETSRDGSVIVNEYDEYGILVKSTTTTPNGSSKVNNYSIPKNDDNNIPPKYNPTDANFNAKDFAKIDNLKETFTKAEGYKVTEQAGQIQIYKGNSPYLTIFKDSDSMSYKYYNNDGSVTETKYVKRPDYGNYDDKYVFSVSINVKGNTWTLLNQKGEEYCSINVGKYPNTEIKYDELGFMKSIIAENKTEKLVYDTNGKLKESYDKEHNYVSHYYDNGKLKEFQNNNTKTVTYYNEDGKINNIQDKKNNTTTYYQNGQKSEIHYENYGAKTYFDKNGNITNVVSDTGNIEDIYKKIIDEIYKKNALGLPSTSEEIDNLVLNFIYEGNVQDFLDYYKNNNPDGEDFLTALANEIGLNKLVKNTINKHIDTLLKNSVVHRDKEEKKENQNYNIKKSNITKTKDERDSYDKNNLSEGNKNHNNIPIIDGGELPEITITGNAGKDVIIKDGYSFKPMTDKNGDKYYQVYSPDGDKYIISASDYEKHINTTSKTNIGNIVTKYGKSDDVVSDKPNNTNNAENNTIKGALSENKHSLAQDAPSAGSTKLPTNDNSWQGSFGQSIINNYGNSDGTLDTNRMTNDWVNNGGTAYTYTGSGAQKAWNAIQNGTWDSGTNYGNTNSGYSEDWSWTGFDVFSVGGGWNDPFGTMSLYGRDGGGGADLVDHDGNQLANPYDKRNSQVMMQVDDRM